MSDPVEQEEQVDVEEATRIAESWLEPRIIAYESPFADDKETLSRAYLALAERVRLLEQREKGLRELIMEWLIDYGSPVVHHGLSERTRRALAASPPNEPPSPDFPVKDEHRERMP